MKAMVFAAGLGTRLKPFTNSHPKALAEVCGQPMLGIVIQKLKAYGVTEFVVNVHHFADQILSYLKSNDYFGVNIHLSDETSKLLDTGGGILAASKWLDGDDDIIVHNADILTDFNLDAMVSAHKALKSMASLLVKDRSTKRYILFEPTSMRMKGWTNVETGAVKPEDICDVSSLRKLAFGGVHLISPKIIPCLMAYSEKISDGSKSIPKFSIMDFYIDACTQFPFYGYMPEESYHWHDIGKPDSLLAAEHDFCSFVNK